MYKILTKATSLLLPAISLLLLAAYTTPKKNQMEFYQLTIYQYEQPAQETVLDNYLEKALLPALHRLGVKNIGVFKAHANDTSLVKKMYVLVPAASLEKLHQLTEKLNTDKQYLQDGAAYINAPYTSPPYTRMEKIILQAFELAPALQVPSLTGSRKERVYELRSYESATEKIYKNKVQMFNAGDEVGLFARLKFNAIFYGEVLSGSHMPNLMYMTSFENMNDRNEHWKKFSEDPYWIKLKAMPEYQKNVSHIDIFFLHPTDYSDY